MTTTTTASEATASAADVTLLITFTESGTNYQDIMHTLSEFPAQIEVMDYDGSNHFHAERRRIRVRLRQVNDDAINLLKTRLSRIGMIQLQEERN